MNFYQANIRIQELTMANEDSAVSLCFDCLCDNHYYADIFPGRDERYKTLHVMFREAYDFCYRNGIILGAFDREDLVGFIMTFDYKKALSEDKESFCSIFDIPFSKSPIDWESVSYGASLHKQILNMKDAVMYMLLLGTKLSYRNHGIGSSLIDAVLNKNESVVSDVSNAESLGMYKKRGFKIEELDTGYYFVSKKPLGCIAEKACDQAA